MGNFLSVDGKFYTFMCKIADLVVVAFLWIVGCLPVVTFLASTASMYYTVVKCIRYDRGHVFQEFKKAYKQNLRQGIGLTLMYGGVGALIGLGDYCVFVQSTNRSGGFFVFAVGVLILSALYLLNLLWIAVVFSRFSNTLGNVLKLNYVIALRNFPRSLLMLLIILIAVILFMAVNELIFILPSTVAWINSHLSERALWRYMPEKKDDSDDWRYGFQ